MANGQWIIVNGQWSMINGQWSMVNWGGGLLQVTGLQCSQHAGGDVGVEVLALVVEDVDAARAAAHLREVA